jgi:hypothetical protein
MGQKTSRGFAGVSGGDTQSEMTVRGLAGVACLFVSVLLIAFLADAAFAICLALARLFVNGHVRRTTVAGQKVP